ncbi:MAG: hypothetical protein MR936_09600 [Eubacterium sp.]|nr:hypothetical protein [Eubacterium sp.]
MVFEYGNQIQVGTCRKVKNSEGKYVPEVSHYSEEEDMIRIDERKDKEEYTITFRHEFGHFIDAKLGRPSMEDSFYQAIQADYAWYDRNIDYGIQNLEKLMSNLEESEAFECRYFSDILSGIFQNDSIIRETYEKNGIAFYHHTNSYWMGICGPAKAVQREIFADLFGIYAENNPKIVAFLEKSFPNTVKRFKESLGGKNGNISI